MIDPPNNCDYDFDCEGRLKCCLTICGRDCVPPGKEVQMTAMLPEAGQVVALDASGHHSWEITWLFLQG